LASFDRSCAWEIQLHADAREDRALFRFFDLSPSGPSAIEPIYLTFVAILATKWQP
jgi:hypothetical protein